MILMQHQAPEPSVDTKTAQVDERPDALPGADARQHLVSPLRACSTWKYVPRAGGEAMLVGLFGTAA